MFAEFNRARAVERTKELWLIRQRRKLLSNEREEFFDLMEQLFEMNAAIELKKKNVLDLTFIESKEVH